MAWLQTAISMLKRHRILLIRYSMGIQIIFQKSISFALPILDMPANEPANSTVLCLRYAGYFLERTSQEHAVTMCLSGYPISREVS